jgi:hypothetical protein
VSLSKRTFKAKAGTTIRFTLSKAAKVSIVVARKGTGRKVGKSCVTLKPSNRKRAACVLFKTTGTQSNADRAAGAISVKFNGKIRGKLLSPGNYKFTLQATDSGGRKSSAVVVTFKVIR